MTLETTTSKAVYTGNGATTEFPFSFKVWDEDQILVSVTDAQGYVQEKALVLPRVVFCVVGIGIHGVLSFLL